MDINEKINEIVFKYNLDQYYPHYRNMCGAEMILRSIIDEAAQIGKKVAFLGWDKTEIEIVRNIVRDNNYISVLYFNSKDLTFRELNHVDWGQYEEIYLTSFCKVEYVERWFRQNKLHYRWIYDEFASRGIFLEREFFVLGKEDLFPIIVPRGIHTYNDRTESLQCELYCQVSRYESANNEEDKQRALEKCLFLAIYIRNFVLAEKYIVLLKKYDERYESAWSEIENLLSIIKKCILNKKKEDIILYWMDSIPYGDEDCMPYLQGVMQDSVVFENAFTYVANTRPTLRAMMLGKKDLDDRTFDVKEITNENSNVIKFLEEQGYNIQVFSGFYYDNFPFEYRTEKFYIDWFCPSSMIIWDAISSMLRQDKKTFCLLHILDAHYPYLSTKMNDSNYKSKNARYRLAREELDEQLSFYDQFFGKDVFRIYMSDHGKKGTIHSRFQVLLNIRHGNLSPRRIPDLVSLLDFETILEQLVEKKNINELEFSKEYIEIGALDYYSYLDTAQVFRYKQELTMQGFGHKGIIDDEYIYIHYQTGKEWLAKRNSLPINNPILFFDCDNDVCEPDLLPKYRALAGEYPKDINSHEKLKYAKYRYMLYHNILKHNDVPERIAIINQILTDFEEKSIAIRMGGEHSAMLYYVLSEENKKKIWGFIDNDSGCMCSALGLPIISSEGDINWREFGIKAVILSSYINLLQLREETEKWKGYIDIIDIYDTFEQRGLVCQGSFYGQKGKDEDYDVDFPFEE